MGILCKIFNHWWKPLEYNGPAYRHRIKSGLPFEKRCVICNERKPIRSIAEEAIAEGIIPPWPEPPEEESQMMDNKGLVLGELMIAMCIIFILLAACTATTTIKDPDGRVYEIVSQKDALVKASMNNGVNLTVDNRGPRSSLQTILDAWALKYITTEDND